MKNICEKTFMSLFVLECFSLWYHFPCHIKIQSQHSAVISFHVEGKRSFFFFEMRMYCSCQNEKQWTLRSRLLRWNQWLVHRHEQTVAMTDIYKLLLTVHFSYTWDWKFSKLLTVNHKCNEMCSELTGNCFNVKRLSWLPSVTLISTHG